MKISSPTPQFAGEVRREGHQGRWVGEQRLPQPNLKPKCNHERLENSRIVRGNLRYIESSPLAPLTMLYTTPSLADIPNVRTVWAFHGNAFHPFISTVLDEKSGRITQIVSWVKIQIESELLVAIWALNNWPVLVVFIDFPYRWLAHLQNLC